MTLNYVFSVIIVIKRCAFFCDMWTERHIGRGGTVYTLELSSVDCSPQIERANLSMRAFDEKRAHHDPSLVEYALLKIRLRLSGVTYNFGVAMYDDEHIASVLGDIRLRYHEERERYVERWMDQYQEVLVEAERALKQHEDVFGIASVNQDSPEEIYSFLWDRGGELNHFGVAFQLARGYERIENELLEAEKQALSDITDRFPPYVAILHCQRGYKRTAKLQVADPHRQLDPGERSICLPLIGEVIDMLPELDAPFKGKDYYQGIYADFCEVDGMTKHVA
jgi:hypothetical protein